MGKTLRLVLQLSRTFYMFFFTQTLFVLEKDLKLYILKPKVAILTVTISRFIRFLRNALCHKEVIFIAIYTSFSWCKK